MTELKRKVLSGLRWSVGARAASQLVTWTSTIVVMRLLQPEDYGLMAMATFFIALCLLLNELGLGAAIVQAKELTELLVRQAFGLVLLMNGALFVILLLATPLIAGFFGEPKLLQIVPALSIQFVIAAFSVIPGALLTRDMDFRSRSIVEVFTMVLGAMITLTLAYAGMGVWALVIGSLANMVTKTVGLNIVQPYFKMPTFSFTGFADRAKYGGYVSLTRVLWYVYSQSDIFVVGKLLGKTLLGYYSVAMHVASLPMQKVGGILQQVALPAYSQLQDNKQLAASYALKASRALSFVAFPVFFGISSVAPELVQIALGDKWLPAILPLQLLSLIIPLRTVQISVGPVVAGMGRPDINVRTLIVACILMPAAFAVGSLWGLLGVCLGWIIAYSLWFVYMLHRSLPIIGVRVSEFLKTLLLPALYSSIMYGAVYLVKLAMTGAHANAIATPVVMVLAGAVVYAGAMLLFSRSTCREIWSMIRN